MSLRAFHIFFILAASALSVLMGLWALTELESAAWAVVAFSGGACLDVYLVWFIRKSRGLRP